MKKVLLTLVVAIAICGSMFAQYNLESHWPDFYYPNYMFESPFVAGVTIDGVIITHDYEGWDELEFASFITNAAGEEECRGNGYRLIDDYVLEWGDPFPIIDGYPLYYTEGGDVVYFKMYDHSRGIEYTDCTVTYLGEPYVVYTGVFIDQGWDDPENPVWLNFNSPPTPTISATANPEEGGTITGTGFYFEGDVCTLSASANPRYYFLNWTEDDTVVSTDAEYSFTVTEDRNLVANFYTNHWMAENYQNDMFMIGVVKVDGVEQASPTLELAAFCNGECRGTEFPIYDEGRWLYYMNIGGINGDSITFRLYDHSLQQELNLCFSVVPFEHYGIIGMESPYEVLFARTSVVSVIVVPEDAGIVTGAGTYINGTEVTLTASSNSTFTNWTIGNEIVSTDTVYSFIVVEDITIVANFLPRYEVTVASNPSEGGSISGAGIFIHGTSCTLVATAYDGYEFVNWTVNDEIVSVDTSYTFTVTAPVDITANFGVLCPVSVSINPENAGVISGIGEYLIGTEAILTATANSGYLFNSWTLDGEVVSTEPSYSFTVTAPVNLTANFDVLYSVSAVVNPEDAGTVTGTGDYVSGTDVTLTATSNEGYVFNNWTLDGEIVSTEPSYTFTVTESVNLTANFNIVRTYQLAQGWNWWSTDLEIALDDLKASLVAALPGTTITIQSQTQNTSYNPNTHRWIGRLTTLDVTQMYLILANTACEITLAGIPVNPAEHPFTVIKGFNWFGFPLNENLLVNNALAGFPAVSGDIIQSQTNNCVFVRGAWRGAVSTFESGKGYMFISNEEDNRVLVFPTSTR